MKCNVIFTCCHTEWLFFFIRLPSAWRLCDGSRQHAWGRGSRFVPSRCLHQRPALWQEVPALHPAAVSTTETHPTVTHLCHSQSSSSQSGTGLHRVLLVCVCGRQNALRNVYDSFLNKVILKYVQLWESKLQCSAYFHNGDCFLKEGGGLR